MKKSLWINIVIIAVIIIVLNLISVSMFHRFDLSKGSMFSLSKTSKSTLEDLSDRLVVKAYFSSNLPPEYADARRYTKDLLDEYSAYSKGKLKFEFIDPGSETELKEEAQKNMISPVQMRINENDKFEVRDVYMGLAFLYQGKTETIPLVQKTQGLEYDITLTIKKLVSEKQKSIAVFKPEDVNKDMWGRAKDNYATFNSVVAEGYTINNSDLTSPLDDTVSGLIITGLTDSLSAEQLHNLDQFIMKGGAVAFFQDRVRASVQTQQAQVIESNLFDLLEHYGVKIKQNLIGDANCGQVSVSRRQGMFSVNTPIEYPFIPIISNFNKDAELVGNIDVMMMVFASELDDSNLPANVEFEPLMYSSNNTKRIRAPRFDINVNNYMNVDLKQLLNEERAILGGVYKGSFKSFFENDPYFEDNINESAPTKIVYIPDSEILLDDAGAGTKTNMEFVLNTLDYISGDSSLIQLRSRGVEYKPLKADFSAKQRKLIKWTNILLPSILLLVYGLISFKLYNNKKKMLEKIYE